MKYNPYKKNPSDGEWRRLGRSCFGWILTAILIIIIYWLIFGENPFDLYKD